MTTTDLIEVVVTTVRKKLTDDPVLVDVVNRLVTVRSFLILSAPSERQVRAVTEEIFDRVKAECGVEAECIGGHAGNRWILIDCEDLVVHVLIDKKREYYVLEKLWSDGTITYLREPRENSLVPS